MDDVVLNRDVEDKGIKAWQIIVMKYSELKDSSDLKFPLSNNGASYKSNNLEDKSVLPTHQQYFTVDDALDRAIGWGVRISIVLFCLSLLLVASIYYGVINP